jgi:predicted GIY-YIG superfamily endonuclease
MRNHDYWVYIFTNKHCTTLYVGVTNNIKGWCRSRKIALVEQTNPRWLDLSDDWEQQPNVYDQPWKAEEMIRDSSLRSE